MAKYGEFASIPDDLFLLLVQEYQTGTFAVATDRTAGLVAMAKAEHAAATATKEPHVVTLTMLCIDFQEQLDALQTATTQLAKDIAHAALLADFQKLEGLWR